MKTFFEEMKKKNTDVDYSLPKIDNLFKYKGNSNASPPAVGIKTSPQTIGGYDINTDFMAEMQNAETAGNYAKAKQMEFLRNQKIGALGLPYGTTHNYNYLDPYAGKLEAMRDEIKNYKPFEYDYRTDDAYLSIKKLKEKEADKAYADGQAQLSTAFDGDIPVNMINKLMTTKNEIIDQADSYIPQLRQMAYDMYNVERNDLYNQYGLLNDVAQQDYNRWSNDRDVRMRGIENAVNQQNFSKQMDYTKERDAVLDSQWQQGFDFNKDSWKQGFDADNAYRNSSLAMQQQSINADNAYRDAMLALEREQWENGKAQQEQQYNTGLQMDIWDRAEAYARRNGISVDAAFDIIKKQITGAAGTPSSSTVPPASQSTATTSVRHKGSGTPQAEKAAPAPRVAQTGEAYVDKNGKIQFRFS